MPITILEANLYANNTCPNFAKLKGYWFRSAEPFWTEAPKWRRTERFRAVPHLAWWSNYFLTFAFRARAADA
jgi:hypothetical protein